MDQELIWQASFLEKKAKETEEEITLIEREINELRKFIENLKYLASSEDKTMLSSLGKGVLIKTEILDKKLFVDIGSGIVIKKNPEEVKIIVNSQIIKLEEAKGRLSARMDFLGRSLQQIIDEIEKTQKKEEQKH